VRSSVAAGSKHRISTGPPATLPLCAPAALPLWMLYPLFFAAMYLSHIALLRLPYFWDEAGYYIPAAWDFFRTGSLVPITTATNGHPPLPSILLAAWWHLSGFVPSGTRTFICMVSAAALLAVYRMARNLVGATAGAAVTLLTALYPIWFAQSTLAHADIFAAAFTLWGLSFYFEALADGRARSQDEAPHTMPAPRSSAKRQIRAAILFSLAALSKETAIVTPVALAVWELVQFIRKDRDTRLTDGESPAGMHLRWIAALLAPALPLAAWYAYHFHRTGYALGNPDFLRYNATGNFNPQRIGLSLYHRLLHLTLHMNLFVPVACAAAAFLAPAIVVPETARRARLPRAVMEAIGITLLANWIAFSVLGGALLTRYLLPMYPLVLLVCVAEWRLHFRAWGWFAAFSTAAFLAGLWINPPYVFAPEDNLTYRDFVVLHQRAAAYIARNYPQATVLTAWPATSELERPELGYIRQPVKTNAIRNFTLDEVQKAAANPGDYDTALVFSTKLIPSPGIRHLGTRPSPSGADARYFDFHQDLDPGAIARMLRGDIVWQAHDRNGREWVAVLRFPRVVDASLTLPH
jgi:4-amino-4-deoxy-L-arabinose transferase-like glycosyltransferase